MRSIATGGRSPEAREGCQGREGREGLPLPSQPVKAHQRYDPECTRASGRGTPVHPAVRCPPDAAQQPGRS